MKTFKLQKVSEIYEEVIIEAETRVYKIEFSYPTGIYIVQRGLYRYEGVNQARRVFRINQDGTEDRII